MSYDVQLCNYICLFISMQTILKIPGFKDNVLTHLLAGLGAGFFAVCIGSPVDVVSLYFHISSLQNEFLFCAFYSMIVILITILLKNAYQMDVLAWVRVLRPCIM